MVVNGLKSTNFYHEDMQCHTELISGPILNLNISETSHLSELILWIYKNNKNTTTIDKYINIYRKFFQSGYFLFFEHGLKSAPGGSYFTTKGSQG